MTFGALPHRLFWWKVRVVAVGAVDRVVHCKPGMRRCVEGPVATDTIPWAVGIAIELERVTGEAFRDFAFTAQVWVGCLFVVTCRAHTDVDTPEVGPRWVMTVVACNAAVDDMQ